MPRSERVTFIGSNGDELAALLDLPDGELSACAVFAHCFTCSKDVFAASRISKALTAHGIGVLRFDFTGLGASDGEFENTTFSTNTEDIRLAIAYLREHHEAPAILIGHSLGGAAILAAASAAPEAVAVATIGAPFQPEHVTNVLGEAIARLAEDETLQEAEVAIAGRNFTIRRDFIDDIAGHRMQDAIRGLGKALLLFHAPLDDVVGVDNARLIFDAAVHPKSFVSLDTADHLLTRREDAIYLADVLAAWVSRHLRTQEGAADATARGTVVVTEAEEGAYAQRIVAGPHALRADEPPGIGDDTGPTPYDLLLSALGACTSMTLRMYAERKGLDVGRISVELQHERIHAADCVDCEEAEGRIERIHRAITVEGDLDEETQDRLTSIANRCPVHRTLEATPRIMTTLAAYERT